MSDAGPAEPVNQNKLREYYVRFGLEPGAPIRDVEAAYWRLARELKGQSAMAPYNEAYEALVARGVPRTVEAAQAAAPVEEVAEEPPAPRPPSKFGWPSN